MPQSKNNALAHVRSKVDVPGLVEKRRAQFIDSAIDLFGQRGYHVTTIRDIAQAAGVSIGLIYQYVEDKEDILFLVLVEQAKSAIPGSRSSGMHEDSAGPPQG